ncbi:hypothetical protein [Clostridium botulinum]|uniref:hypothetical protein n=1 Tax=Clostridium botulinum TaxID=1491 RepID=UPI000772FCB5|nr:hypothetical protein [Clostridium botulinum]NFN09370.1 hypothetical protein [Clostridium botulinum]NFN32950.1 hypothetical protein [Clostridium botulinum]
MNIRIGDIVKYHLPFGGKSVLGTIREIHEIKNSVNKNRIGETEYQVSDEDKMLQSFTVGKDEIEAVYRDIKESEVKSKRPFRVICIDDDCCGELVEGRRYIVTKEIEDKYVLLGLQEDEYPTCYFERI